MTPNKTRFVMISTVFITFSREKGAEYKYALPCIFNGFQFQK